MREQIWLIGFMGTGKTRIARPLAAALDWERLDIDDLIVEEAGETVAEIFEKQGEGGFRALESRVIARVAEKSKIVVATGGGSVLAEENREAMRRGGFIVCLDARPETIATRILESGRHVSERPLLRGDDPLLRITQMKAEREPYYREADFIIQTDDMTPDQVTHQILLAFREKTAVRGAT